MADVERARLIAEAKAANAAARERDRLSAAARAATSTARVAAAPTRAGAPPIHRGELSAPPPASRAAGAPPSRGVTSASQDREVRRKRAIAISDAMRAELGWSVAQAEADFCDRIVVFLREAGGAATLREVGNAVPRRGAPSTKGTFQRLVATDARLIVEHPRGSTMTTESSTVRLVEHAAGSRASPAVVAAALARAERERDDDRVVAGVAGGATAAPLSRGGLSGGDRAAAGRAAGAAGIAAAAPTNRAAAAAPPPGFIAGWLDAAAAFVASQSHPIRMNVLCSHVPFRREASGGASMSAALGADARFRVYRATGEPSDAQPLVERAFGPLAGALRTSPAPVHDAFNPEE